MSERAYFLMHKDDTAATVTIDDVTGAMLRVAPQAQPELLPLGGRKSPDELRAWWQRRAVPVSQGIVQRYLEQMGLPTPQAYLVRNLGLSLSDHYWIKPVDAALTWSDVSLFSNDFRDPVGALSFTQPAGDLPVAHASSYSPGSSLQGDLKKAWIISDGKRMLVKGKPRRQQSGEFERGRGDSAAPEAGQDAICRVLAVPPGGRCPIRLYL